MSPFLVVVLMAGAASCTSQRSEKNVPSRIPPTSGESSSSSSSLPSRTRALKLSAKTAARRVHDRINRERQRQGLPTFRWDSSLSRIARKHSRDMEKRNFFGHTTPEGSGPAERYLRNGYACGITIDGVLRRGAEVVYRASMTDAPADAAGTASSGDGIAGPAISAWKANAEDRKNILSPHWQREGVGVFFGPDGVVYITVNFC